MPLNDPNDERVKKVSYRLSVCQTCDNYKGVNDKSGIVVAYGVHCKKICSGCPNGLSIKNGSCPMGKWKDEPEGEWTVLQPARGVGDIIAKATHKMGIRQCGGCKRRQKQLNKITNFGKLKSSIQRGIDKISYKKGK